MKENSEKVALLEPQQKQETKKTDWLLNFGIAGLFLTAFLGGLYGYHRYCQMKLNVMNAPYDVLEGLETIVCSGHGYMSISGECVCDEDFTGENCEYQVIQYHEEVRKNRKVGAPEFEPLDEKDLKMGSDEFRNFIEHHVQLKRRQQSSSSGSFSHSSSSGSFIPSSSSSFIPSSSSAPPSSSSAPPSSSGSSSGSGSGIPSTSSSTTTSSAFSSLTSIIVVPSSVPFSTFFSSGVPIITLSSSSSSSSNPITVISGSSTSSSSIVISVTTSATGTGTATVTPSATTSATGSVTATPSSGASSGASSAASSTSAAPSTTTQISRSTTITTVPTGRSTKTVNFPSGVSVAPPPAPTLAQFDDSGANIDVYFDRAVWVLDSADTRNVLDWDLFYCEDIFMTRDIADAVLARADNPDDCFAYFLAPNILRISIESVVAETDLAIVPTQSLLFKDEIVVSAGYDYSYGVVGTIVVRAPNVIPVPSVVLRGPEIIDGCPDLEIEALVLSGQAGRPWASVSITFTTSLALANDSLFVAGLTQAASDLKLSAPSALIAKELVAARDYVLNFTFANFLGGKASYTFAFTKVPGQDVPSVSIKVPMGQIDFTKMLVVSASAKPSACNRTDGINYSWSSPNFTLSGDTSSSVYIVDALTFNANARYTFRVSAQYALASNAYTFSTTFTTKPETLTVFSGNSAKVSSAAGFSSVASIVSNAPLATGTPTCSWVCTTIPAGTPCVNAQTNAAFVFGTSCTSISFAANTLTAGQIAVTLTVVKNGLTFVGAPAYYDVVTPVTLAIGVTQARSFVSARSNKIEFNAAVTTTASQDAISYLWSSPSTCFGTTYTALNLTNTTNLALPNGRNILKIAPGVLRNGAKYCFKVSVNATVNGITTSGEGYGFITVASGPSNGYCARTGTTGNLVALSGVFTMLCKGWTADASAYPLTYAFEWAKDNNGVWGAYSTARARSDSPQFSTTLSPGRYRVRAIVYDNLDTVNAVEQFEIVSTTDTRLRRRQISSSTSTSGITYLTTAWSNFNLTKNAATALQNLGVIAPVLQNNIGASTDLALQWTFISFLNHVTFSGSLAFDDTTGPYVIGLLSQTTGNQYTLLNDRITPYFSILHRASNATSVALASQNSCFTPATASSAGGVIDAILGSISRNGTFNSFVSTQLFNTTTVIDNCLFRNLACGQTPLSWTNSRLNHTLGIDDTFSANRFCAYNFSSSSAALGRTSCVRYACFSYDSTASNNNALTAPVLSRAATLTRLNFALTNGTAITGISFTGSNHVNFTVNVPNSFITANNLTTWNPTGTNPATLFQFNPVCVAANPSSFTQDTACSVIAIGSTSITCRCQSLNEAGIGLVSNGVASQTASATSTSSGSASGSATATVTGSASGSSSRASSTSSSSSRASSTSSRASSTTSSTTTPPVVVPTTPVVVTTTIPDDYTYTVETLTNGGTTQYVVTTTARVVTRTLGNTSGLTLAPSNTNLASTDGSSGVNGGAIAGGVVGGVVAVGAVAGIFLYMTQRQKKKEAEMAETDEEAQ